MKKLFSAVIALALCANIALAAKNEPVKAASVAEVPVTIIVMDNDATGGPDAGLNNALEQVLGTKLKIETVNRSVALGNPEYQGLNLDFMPLYLVEMNDLVQEKFGQYIQAGQMRVRNGKLILEHQTRNGVYAGKDLRPMELDLYVMSQCPYGVRAENQIIDLMKLGRLPKDLKINIRYIVSEGADGSINSLHGSAEWEEDVRQLIIREKYPNKFWKYLEIRNKDYRSSLWDRAAEEAGINPRIFAKYWDFGVKKLKEEIAYTRDYNISGSPSFIWQGRTATDLGSLGSIKGLEGFQTNLGGGNAGGGAPQGRC